jgi:hypothetical protein
MPDGGPGGLRLPRAQGASQVLSESVGLSSLGSLDQLSGDPPGRRLPTRGSSARPAPCEATNSGRSEGDENRPVRPPPSRGEAAPAPGGSRGESARSALEGAQPPGPDGGAPRSSAGSPSARGLSSRAERAWEDRRKVGGGECDQAFPVALRPFAMACDSRVRSDGDQAFPASRVGGLAGRRARIQTLRREPGHVRHSRSAPPRCSRRDRMRTPHRGSSLSTASGRVPGPRGGSS